MLFPQLKPVPLAVRRARSYYCLRVAVGINTPADARTILRIHQTIHMQQAKQFSLILGISVWAILIGGIAYSNLVYMPPYLTHLPDSNSLIRGEYGLHDENFWMLIHPIVILISIAMLLLNWKQKRRRTLIATAFGIYAVALIVTAFYFVPELKAFAAADPTVDLLEWRARGAKWLSLSIVRGGCIFVGFVLLLLALSKGEKAATA